MSIFSKLRAQTLTPIFKRKLHFPNDGWCTNPVPYIEKMAEEPHAKHLGPVVNVCLWVIIPVLSAYCFYTEYNHLYVHRHRPRYPKMDFVNQGVNHWPCNDGKHSCLHHEYFNFTPYGYETDKQGNRLPPGVYADE